MDMDNTTEFQQQQAMAMALYSGLRGIEVDAETRALAASYCRNLFVTPWQDVSEARTQAYAQRFFAAVHHLGKTTKMVDQWQDCFDADHMPMNPEQARAFITITDFFRVHLHHPRDYHNFVCQRRDIKPHGVLDFPVEHPISVEFWAIYITIHGTGTLSADGKSTCLRPGSVAVVPPGCNCTLSRSSDAEHWCYDWLSFRSNLDWIELLDWAHELTRPILFAVDNPDSFRYLIQQTEQLESTTYLPDTLSERLCNNIIENLLIRLRILAEARPGRDTQINRKVQGAVDYILNHYGEDITLDIIADRVNISPSRLSVIFREHFGISVIKWRDHVRMQKAKALIRHSRDSISHIASRVGYPGTPCTFPAASRIILGLPQAGSGHQVGVR